jgi:hypothetical protein
MRGTPAVVLLATLLAGCASYSWYKPNVPPEIAQRDSDDCRRQAAYRVNTELMADDPFWWGPGHRYWGPPPGIPVSGLALEQDAYRRCMNFKGYTLVKDPEPAHPSGAQ